MSSLNDSRSLLEPPVGQPVGHLMEQRLSVRLAPPQGVEPDPAGVEIDLGADQPVSPRGVHLEPPAQQLDTALLTGPPQIDDPPARPRLQVQVPGLGERPAGRGRCSSPT